MIREAIAQLIEGKHLSQEQAAQVMEEIMEGQATPAQLGAFLIALRLKGETVDEIAGLARVMREKALHVPVKDEKIVDTCGTGGDASGTYNISTASALVAAGAGLKVAKHGNRSMTSACGSADVLEALGVKIDLGPEGVARCIEEAGIGFMFAPTFHPAMRHAAGPRREIGVRTAFNILGPLTNPAGATHQVVGVASANLVSLMAEVLRALGAVHALVIHGEDGLDELTLGGPTLIAELKSGKVATRYIQPEDVGLQRVSKKEIAGGDAQENARIMRAVLGGEAGPRREVLLLNAAAALVAGDAAHDLPEGIELARKTIDSGAALARLESLIQVSRAAASASI